MSKHVLIYLALLLLSTSTIFCLPFDLRLLNPAQRAELDSWIPERLPPSAPAISSYRSWSSSAYSAYQPIQHHASSHPFPVHLPHIPSGPWNKAWELYESTVEKFKLFKRANVLSAPEQIAMHLRPKGWIQKLKDLWRRITFRRLKITPAQVEQVKRKYRRPRVSPYEQRRRKDGRFGSGYSSFRTYTSSGSGAGHGG